MSINNQAIPESYLTPFQATSGADSTTSSPSSSQINNFNETHQQYFNTNQPIPSVPYFPTNGNPPEPVWSNPYSLDPNSGIYQQSYLFLEAMKMNPDNSNYAIVFLEACYELAAIGAFGGPNGNAFSAGLLAITGPGGKSLVDECVDITMLQLCLNTGCSPDQAAAQINKAFGGFTDPVSEEICAEANSEATTLDGYENSEKYQNYENLSPDQQQAQGQNYIDQQWYNYMSDPTTVSSIDNAQSELMNASLDSCGDNIYAALLVLLLLLEASSVTDIDAEGNLSNQLSDETAQLNTLITEWNNGMTDGWTSQQAEQWMDQLQKLQFDMNQTPFDSATMTNINEQFNTIDTQQAMGYNSHPPQETYPNGQPEYVDANGQPCNADGQLVDSNGDPLYIENGKDTGYNNVPCTYTGPVKGNNSGYTRQPGYGYSGAGSTSDHFTPDMGTGPVTPVYDTSQPSENYPVQANYPNGTPEFTDANGKSVNSSGQEVDANGNPLYANGTIYYDSTDGNYYYEGSNPPKQAPAGNYQPTMGTGPFTPVTAENNDLYVDPATGQTYYETSDGQYINADTGQIETLPEGDTVVPLTISDQAYGNPNEHYAEDPDGLADSFNAFDTEQPVNPDDPNAGGMPVQDSKIINALDALSSPITAQSSIVGSEMQQIAGYLKIYENTFESTLVGQSGEIGLESAINSGMRA